MPKGKVAGPFKLPSDVFPGVAHDYWVYVPAQYDGKTEVSLMVFNDGATYMQPDGYYRAVNVLDNLIYRRELPVMVAAFIDPGTFTADGRSNRQAEYDPVTDRYSRVVVGELLPKLYAEYRISRDPDRHGIAGWSSGAIAAFTVAWERSGMYRQLLPPDTQGYTTPAPVGFCGATCLELTIPGTGTASHMGSVGMVGLTQIDVATLGQTGTSTLTAADGSMLEMSFTGAFTPGPAGPSDATFGGTWTATGGTGRFNGVSGGGTYHGSASGPAGILFLNGSLSNPGKAPDHSILRPGDLATRA